MDDSSEKKLSWNFFEIFTAEEFKEILKKNQNLHDKETLDIQKEIDKKREKSGILNISRLMNQNIHQSSGDKDILKLHSKKFNIMLGGGFSPNKIYLIYGEYATGKSQIAHHLCVSLYDIQNVQESQTTALFLDTEDTFRPKRINQISESYRHNGSLVLKKIQVLKIKSTEMLNLFLTKLIDSKFDEKIGLLIIDSLTNYIRADFADKEKSSFSVKKSFKKILQKLRKIHDIYQIPIILTSQVTPRPSNKLDSKFTVKPTMEYLINEFIDDSIFVYKGRGTERHAYLFNSNDLKEDDIVFKISNEGIIDV